MTPAEIVSELDKNIIGQKEAKKAVAIALRNRWRRLQVAEPLRHEITPKNILMIGPTGVGKTEIARRLAKIANAPFVKVEATKFTEVGYVGRDVDTIIRDLVDVAIKQTRALEIKKMRVKAEEIAEERILDILLPPAANTHAFSNNTEATTNSTRQTFRKRLREGQLNDTEIEIEVKMAATGVDVMGPPGMEEMAEQFKTMFAALGRDQKKKRKLTIKEALELLTEEEAGNLINEEEIKSQAIENAEQNGIVFLDEVDKIAVQREVSGGDVSRQGVQRDLLPLVEGTTVSTKFGPINTDHILFIASGAFHLSKPSDLIPELQGRFPIRVELDALSVEDFAAILTQTDNNLVKQYQALLATEDVELIFQEDAITRIAQIAFDLNDKIENIGARRLYTVLECLLEDIAYKAGSQTLPKQIINAHYVDENLGEVAQNQDLSRYIL